MIHLTQLVYVHPGREAEFHAFEDIVLPLLARHRGELVLRLRPDPTSKIAGSADAPYEIHVVRFDSEEDLLRYSEDDLRRENLVLKERSVREAVVFVARSP